MPVGGSRLPPRSPPAPQAQPVHTQGKIQQPPASASQAATARLKTVQQTPAPAAPASTAPAASRPASVTPDGVVPSTSRPATPQVSLGAAPSGLPPEPASSEAPQKKLTTSTSAGYKHVDTQTTSLLDHGTQGLGFHLGAAKGGRVTLAGADVTAQADYKPTSNVQISGQATAATNLGSAHAWASGGVDPHTREVAGQVAVGAMGPSVAGVLTQTTQLGPHVKNELQTVGFATAGSANASAQAQYNPTTGEGSVNAGFSAMGPSAMLAGGNTFTLGPFKATNNVIASVGTVGIQGNAHASNTDGVWKCGIDYGLMMGGGLMGQHSLSYDTNYFRQPPPPPPTALGQAQANQKKYGEPAAAS